MRFLQKKLIFFLVAISFILIGLCSSDIIPEQTEKSLPHIERAEKFVKEKNYKSALLEYNYVLQFYPESIYAEQARQAIEELTPRTKPKNLEKQRAIVSPSRLSFMPTPENLKQGVLSISGGTSILGEFKAGVYDWLEVGLISGILVEVKAKVLNEYSFTPSFALGAVAPAWNLEIGEIYGIAGKKLGRFHLYAGWSYIAGESAAFGGTKLDLSKRSSILMEYNQPIFFEDRNVFYLIDFSQNLNTAMGALRFIFPHNIGVETGLGIYTRPEYRYDQDTGRETRIGENYNYFLRLQLFWSVWL